MQRRLQLTSCILSVLTWLSAASITSAQSDVPDLPSTPFDYVTYAVTNLPEHYKTTPPFGDAGASNNTPTDNPITNDGATLGRVLFYDTRLSLNDTISCSSCHTQETGFGDTRQFSVGYVGDLTPRHSMALTNSVFYESGRFRWDESAETLEVQCLIPIEAPDEMGLPLDDLRVRLEGTEFYEELFVNAFGDAEVTNDRIAKALAQFQRAMVSYNAKYDQAFDAGQDGMPNFEAVFSESEIIGQQLFERTPKSVRCNVCHRTTAFIGTLPHNIGLDATVTDEGAGGGRFKVASLRNVAVRGRFMHDGRFQSLEEVVEFYNSGVQESEFVDDLLRINEDPTQPIEQLKLTEEEKQGLVDFMHALTDNQFLNDPKFSDPFGPQVLFGDANLDGSVDMLDIAEFVNRISNGPYLNEADINQDGVINLLDVQPFVNILTGGN